VYVLQASLAQAQPTVPPASADRHVEAWRRVFPPTLVDRSVAGERLRVVVVPAGSHAQLVSAAKAVEAAFAGSTRVEAVRLAPMASTGGDAEIVRTHAASGEHVAVVRVLDVDARMRAIVTIYAANGTTLVEMAGWADDPASAEATAAAAPEPTDPFAGEPAGEPATPAPVARATDEETERPSHAESKKADAQPEFDRIGVLGTASVGVLSCGQPLCALVPVGGVGRFEIGWRYKWIAPVVSLAIGGAPVDVPEETTVLPDEAPDDVKAALRFLDVGVGVQVFPITFGRIDPWVRFGLAYSRVAFVVKDSETKYHQRYSRGGAQLGGGLSIYVARHVAIGPRFDIVLPFAGKFCEELDDEPLGDDGACRSVSDLVATGMSAQEERAIRRIFPKPWSVTVDARFVF
jgi:hypothetical protein